MRLGGQPPLPRLGVVTNFFPSLTETFIYREIAGLEGHGIGVRVYSVRRPPESDVAEGVRHLRRQTYYLLPLRWGELLRAHAGWLLRRPLRYLATLGLVLGGRHVRLKDRLRSAIHFAEGAVVAAAARHEAIGHLHAHYASHPATIALTAARLLGVPFSFTGHAYDIWTDRLLLPEKMAACRFAITCTEAARRALLREAPKASPQKVTTIYHGVDIDHFSPGSGRDPGAPFTILSVGRLDRQKGHQHLLAAAGRLVREGHDLKLCIVGSGPWRGQLEELARQCGMAGRTTFAGRVYHEHLPDYYRAADLFVLACFNDEGNQDNLPNVLLEAMACGVPAVSTRLQGIPELIEDGVNGLLTEPEDTDALTVAMRGLLEDREAARRLGEAGRRRVVAHFDLAASVARLAVLYRGALNLGSTSAGLSAANDVAPEAVSRRAG